jgi:hypothetical protein
MYRFPSVLEAVRPPSRHSVVGLAPAELVDVAPAPLPLVRDDQVQRVEVAFAVLRVGFDVDEPRTVGGQHRLDVARHRPEPIHVLVRRDRLEAARRIVLALRGVRRRGDGHVDGHAPFSTAFTTARSRQSPQISRCRPIAQMSPAQVTGLTGGSGTSHRSTDSAAATSSGPAASAISARISSSLKPTRSRSKPAASTACISSRRISSSHPAFRPACCRRSPGPGAASPTSVRAR